MGLSDRDYMHERKPSFSEGKKSRKNTALRSTLSMILTWIFILFLLYKSFLWWDSKQQTRKEINPSLEITTPASTTIGIAPRYIPPETGRRQEDYPSRTDQPSTNKQSITKCVINGQVSFTDGVCPNGATTSNVTVNTSNVGTVPATKFVPTSLPVQIYQAPTLQPIAEIQNARSTNEAECNFLRQQIDYFDALARQPQSGQAQDNISAERKKLRSRQFALGC